MATNKRVVILNSQRIEDGEEIPYASVFLDIPITSDGIYDPIIDEYRTIEEEKEFAKEQLVTLTNSNPERRLLTLVFPQPTIHKAVFAFKAFLILNSEETERNKQRQLRNLKG